jgi:hypothetical protein
MLFCLQELEDGPWSQANVDAGSSKIIPVPHPLGGAIVLGESVLSYFNMQHATRSTQIKPNTSIQVRTREFFVRMVAHLCCLCLCLSTVLKVTQAVTYSLPDAL